MKKDILSYEFAALGFSQKTIDSIISELNYQERINNNDNIKTDKQSSNAEFLVFIQNYLREAINIISRGIDHENSILASENIRKIAAMVIYAAEINGWSDLLSMFLKENRVQVDKLDIELTVTETLSVVQNLTNKTFEIIPYEKFGIADIYKGKEYLSNILYFSLLSMEKNHATVRIKE